MHHPHRTTRLLQFALLLGASALAHAEVSVSPLFSDHMVLQRGVALPVWGWATAGEPITVSIDGQEQHAVTDKDGRWMLRLAPLQVGAPRTMTISGRTETLRIADILLGEVWLCAGQSNMVWPVSAADHGAQELAAASHPEIRLFEVAGGKSPVAEQERLDPNHLPDGMNGSGQARCVWRASDPKSAVSFSAVGYFFGRALHEQLHVPIGLISNAVGATPIEAWMSHAALSATPEFRKALEWWAAVDGFADTAEGKRQLLALDEAGLKRFGKWSWRADSWLAPHNRLGHPSTFYNSRVHPLVPFALKGVIWYQGEGNTGNAIAYRDYFPALISDWRQQWGQGDFPFLFVQLANWGGAPPAQPQASEWAELRESQALALRLPNTGMAVAIDIGDPGNIHPRNKQDVGARLALAARAVAYGEQIVHAGPTYRDLSIDGNRLRLHFTSLGGGLVAKGGPLRGFALAGADRRFVWADAVIEGDTITVSAEAVPQPVAVRYGWAHNPGCNLCNVEGLPAAPFRSDDWPGVTTGKGFAAKDPATALAFPIPQ